MHIIQKDASRYGFENFNIFNAVKIFFFHPLPGLKFTIIFRLLQYYRKRNRFFFIFFYLWYRRLRVKYGIDISFRTKIGAGLYIGHFGGIVVHGDAVIGECCNLSQGITIGVSNHGKNKGIPVIGDYVFLGPNCCVLGGIVVGNNVTIGANTVLSENVEPHSTVLPGRPVIIKKDLSDFYIHNQ